ncbi:MAG: type II toxin-antitoxin system PemK/MazF family toxin [Erysipelotrichaceae bacterium]|nr:type II toxin-antitoxin system PemK/MazF family toxin [Erysipelotrichaceae bacterium]MBR2544902.1 hypothetical protein [Erysipelotrichaceae bacterium]MBR2702525.1 hypothetical protein [Erysipelotrichaceae bacterium]MBR2746299.1 hypothetical protein [Erysipelotrichaceae bacterium]
MEMDVIKCDYRNIESLIEQHIDELRDEYYDMPLGVVRNTLISEYNYKSRGKLKSCRHFGLNITAGDICYIDFGRAYISEAGYQHFGVVLNVFNGKAFVIPMTSNSEAYRNAYDPENNPSGLKHLYRLGYVEGLYRESVLFLNDGKYINTARIIDVKGHIDVNSSRFRDIRKRFLEGLSI